MHELEFLLDGYSGLIIFLNRLGDLYKQIQKK